MAYRDAKNPSLSDPPENWRMVKPKQLKVELKDLTHIDCFDELNEEYGNCVVQIDRTKGKLYVVTSPYHISTDDRLYTEEGKERTFSLKYLLNLNG